ncbi:hypothetical protein [Aequorivita echinoideorum]|uniref:Uncharacterized protein n=1 Tax=Aequorivita echinoideorum TaxID=1549647 RepID=A0ABS5S7E2_9FLAO|nr:hypothetical protein [Aequorivita echinoideorum]MBT0609099.1 hypothetical protein [Aequorivita echinoideorum]
MKNILLLAAFSICFYACNDGKKDSLETPSDKIKAVDSTLTTAQWIANANGYEKWKDISEIKFTFNVDRGEKHYERSWMWKPIAGEVMMVNENDTVNYNRNKVMDSIIVKSDGAFINDKYWLLAPFQIAWDEGTSFSEKKDVTAPISGEKMNQLTVVYGNEGGYTPGDAYDFFYDENYMIKEWIYREGNSEKPSMATTWEDYKNFNGIEIATMHKDSTGAFKLYFTNISVK